MNKTALRCTGSHAQADSLPLPAIHYAKGILRTETHMKKLLLLALLALGLGGGVWKAQNPEGTLDNLKSQSVRIFTRVKTGVEAGVDTIVNNAGGENSSNSETAKLDDNLEDGSNEQVAGATVAEVTALVEDKFAENASSLASLQGTLNERSASMEAVTAAVAELDNAQQETRARTDAGNVRQDAIERRLDLLVRRIDEQTTEDELSELSATVQTQQEQVNSLQTDLVERQRALDESVSDMQEQTRDLDLRLGTLLVGASAAAGDSNSADQDTLDALSISIDERLNGIEDRLTTVNADSRRIGELNEQLASAREKIVELEQNYSQTTDAVSELDSSVQALTTVGESLSIDTIQAQIRDQLASAQSQIDSSPDNNTTQLEALLETTRNRIQTLEQRVQDLPASSSEADDALQNQSALQAQIADLEQRLEGLSNTDPALENTVNDVKEQVEQLSSQGFVTREDLRASEQSESIEYKIYFERNSTDISEDAASVLNSFIAQEKNRTTGVSIFGFTDRAGSAAYNQQLALQRATKVRSYLIQNGLDFTKIKTLSGLGEDAAATVLPDDSADAQQRVVVLYADQP